MVGDIIKSDLGQSLGLDYAELLSSESCRRTLTRHGAFKQLNAENADKLKQDVFSLLMTGWLQVDPLQIPIRFKQLEEYERREISALRSGKSELGLSMLSIFADAASLALDKDSEIFQQLSKDLPAVYLKAIETAKECLSSGRTLQKGEIYFTGQSLFFDLSSLRINRSDSTAQPTKAITEAAHGITLSELIHQFNNVHETKKKGIQLLNKYEIYQDYLLELLGGNTHISSITKPFVRENLYLILEHLPANATKRAEFRGMNRKQIAAKAKARTDVKKLAASTKSDIIGHLSLLFKFAQGEGYDVKDPAKGFTYQDEVASEDKRLPFSVVELNQIFTSQELRDAKHSLDKAYLFWIPFVGLLTGMRIGEIVQLRCKDIRKDGSYWYISINTEDGKTTKTTHSVRTFPFYSPLIQLGFLDYCERAQEQWGNDASLFQPSCEEKHPVRLKSILSVRG